MYFNFDNTLLRAPAGTLVHIILHEDDGSEMLYLPANIESFDVKTINDVEEMDHLWGDKDFFTIVLKHNFKKKYKKDVLKLKWSYWEPDYKVHSKKRYQEYASTDTHKATADTFYIENVEGTCTVPHCRWDHCFITSDVFKMQKYLKDNKVIEKNISYNAKQAELAMKKFNDNIEEAKRSAQYFGISI